MAYDGCERRTALCLLRSAQARWRRSMGARELMSLANKIVADHVAPGTNIEGEGECEGALACQRRWVNTTHIQLETSP